MDAEPTTPWIAADPSQADLDYYPDEHTEPLDDASRRAIEGAPWGWLVVGAIAAVTAALFALLYLQG